MIKSKHNTFKYWFFMAITGFFFLIAVVGVLNYFSTAGVRSSNKADQSVFGLMSLGFGCFSIIFLFVLSTFTKQTIIDTYGNSITFKNSFTGSKKTYSFSAFDGFVDTYLTSKTGKTKIVGLIKGKRIVRYIDSSLYSNYNELRTALAPLIYLGTLELGAWKQFKLLFGLQIMDGETPA